MQTAVNWLISVLAHNDILDHKALSSNERLYNLYKRLKEQAETKEKQQIIDAAERWKGTDFAEKYYAETYGSKGSDDQVPDVRKMVEDDNYLTPVDWLMDRIKWIHRETYDYLIKEGQYDVAKRTENAILNKANELQSSQTEISDEEIEKYANERVVVENVFVRGISAYYLSEGAKWYREQLKKKQ